MTESQTTNGRTPEGEEGEDKATDAQLATEAETGATPEDGERVEKVTDVQLADETKTGAAQEGGRVTHEEAAGKESEMRTPSAEASKQESPEGDQGDRKSEKSTTEKSHMSAQSESSRKEKGKDKGKEKEKGKDKEKKRDKQRDKEKKEKKQKKRSKHQGHDESPHTSRKHPSKLETHSQQSGEGNKQLEAILLSNFQPFDPDGTGYMEPSVFWEVGIRVFTFIQTFSIGGNFRFE